MKIINFYQIELQNKNKLFKKVSQISLTLNYFFNYK